jgi:hypothetical protein
MDSINVHSWQDLKHFGINALTGEACKFSRRLLCDLNEDGAALMMDYLGVTMLAQNWNSTVNDKPAVASVMLHRSTCIQIAEFALLRSPGIKAIVYNGDSSIMGVFTDKLVEQYHELVKNWPNTTAKWSMITCNANYAPGVGSRNTHAMSGRTV